MSDVNDFEVVNRIMTIPKRWLVTSGLSGRHVFESSRRSLVRMLTLWGWMPAARKEIVISLASMCSSGVGAYRCGKDMVRAGIVPEGFDMSVYKEEGMAGMSKAGEDRPFKFIARLESGWGSADIWKVDAGTRRKIMYLTVAQCYGDETH